MRLLLSILLLALVMGCSNPTPSAEEVVSEAIAFSGGDAYQHVQISFDFRDMSYSIKRDGGWFDMTRTQYPSPDSVIVDRFHNYGFQRTINDSMVSVSDSMAELYKASINSVIYFFSLPYGLLDPAANHSYAGQKMIKNKTYYKIKVWFDEQGGGTDYQDVFYYWFDTEDYSMDFLAYSFETDGGGMRFREAIHPRRINGIQVLDYVNYSPTDTTVQLETIDDAYLQGQLKVLSHIENDNVTVSLLEE